MAVSELKAHIVKTCGCNKQTFYTYLSDMPTVGKEKHDGRLYCFLISPASGKKVDNPYFTRFQSINDPELRPQIERAIRNLTLENVDLGLFELGKILESELKKLLFAIKEHGVLEVSRNNTNRLVNMIDFVETHGIVTNRHHLTFLRQERNERAHRESPK